MKPDLDALINLAEQHARMVLLELQDPQLVPQWLLVLPHGKFAIVGTPWRNQHDKERMLKKMRAHLKKVHALAYSFLGETWYATAPKGTDLTNLEGMTPPSLRLDRQEAVIAIAADCHRSKGQLWRIERDATGQIIALTTLGEAHHNMVSQFLGLLQGGN